MQVWTIPLEGTTYVCWIKNGEVDNRPLSLEEENEYFSSRDKDRFLNELLRRG